MVNENDNVKNRTLGTTRIFNAPLEIVWKVWSDVDHLNNWWGPRGFTQTTAKHEFRENGAWSFVMHGPNGVDYQNEMVYLEIVPLKKIVIRHDSPPHFTVTALFKAIDSKRTQVDFIQVIDDQKVHDVVKDFAIVANMEHQMKFEAELAKLTNEIVPMEFVISREFNGDLETMWKMFTEPTHMASWYGPKEIETGHCDMNFKRGGHYHFSMIAEDKNESWGKLYYIDIVKNIRLIYVTTFSNKKGEITRHPMAPMMPAELLTTVNFIKINDNKSKIEIRWYPINALPEEIKMFNDFHGSFTMGWTGSLDRLESVLKV
jgi:uncharacterized protein YndB with AHSA1/START domain